MAMKPILGLSLVFANLLAAQPGGTPMLSPVPFLKPDGTVPGGMPAEGVYLDVMAGQAVVFYRPALASGAGPLRKLVVPVAVGMKPGLIAGVALGPSGFNYEFTLANGPEARQGIRLFRFSDSALERVIWQEGPPGWTNRMEPGSISWKAESDSIPPIAPGGQQRFRLTSLARPGLLRAAAQGESSDFRPPADLPKPLADELARVLQPSFNSHVFLTWGPKYAPDASQATIAGDLLGAIEFLSELKQVDLLSPYTSALRNILRPIAEGHAAGSSVRLTASPGTPREREIDSAVRMGLNIN